MSKIEKFNFTPEGADKTLKHIRMYISLLVSEELAEDIYEELTTLVKTATKEQ